jgi:hypothetical protein
VRYSLLQQQRCPPRRPQLDCSHWQLQATEGNGRTTHVQRVPVPEKHPRINRLARSADRKMGPGTGIWGAASRRVTGENPNAAGSISGLGRTSGGGVLHGDLLISKFKSTLFNSVGPRLLLVHIAPSRPSPANAAHHTRQEPQRLSHCKTVTRTPCTCSQGHGQRRVRRTVRPRATPRRDVHSWTHALSARDCSAALIVTTSHTTKRQKRIMGLRRNFSRKRCQTKTNLN